MVSPDLLGRLEIKISHSNSDGSELMAATDSEVAIMTPPEHIATPRVIIKGPRGMLIVSQRSLRDQQPPPFICALQEPCFPLGCDIFNISILCSIWQKFHYCSSRCRENANLCVGETCFCPSDTG